MALTKTCEADLHKIITSFKFSQRNAQILALAFGYCFLPCHFAIDVDLELGLQLFHGNLCVMICDWSASLSILSNSFVS